MWVYKNQLYHHGIKGMKWGVRRTPEQLGRKVENKISRTARKDAERAEVARVAYGKGAGIKRRLIQQELKDKMKDPLYKKYYNEALDNMNSAKIRNKAVRDSKGRAAKDQTKRTAKAVATFLTGTSSLAAAYIFYNNHKETVHRAINSVLNKTIRG